MGQNCNPLVDTEPRVRVTPCINAFYFDFALVHAYQTGKLHRPTLFHQGSKRGGGR